MPNALFTIFYFLGTLFTWHMAAAFTIMGSLWLGVLCIAIGTLFLVLMYKDGITAYDQ